MKIIFFRLDNEIFSYYRVVLNKYKAKKRCIISWKSAYPLVHRHVP